MGGSGGCFLMIFGVPGCFSGYGGCFLGYGECFRLRWIFWITLDILIMLDILDIGCRLHWILKIVWIL